jgi:hypothetical protein
LQTDDLVAVRECRPRLVVDRCATSAKDSSSPDGRRIIEGGDCHRPVVASRPRVIGEDSRDLFEARLRFLTGLEHFRRESTQRATGLSSDSISATLFRRRHQNVGLATASAHDRSGDHVAHNDIRWRRFRRSRIHGDAHPQERIPKTAFFSSG